MEYDPYDMAHVGKIVEINGDEAKVNFNGITRSIKISLVNANVGDYVLVHAGYAIKVLNPEEVEEDLRDKIKSLLSD
ncbi:HypC/HybG/HupF family hydrogenase formation chaperone [Saccharolobus islandicus]|jgi:hydrogenase expression/formation protein HypC|uniref:Hydrogenase expression/formation protein (HUPF/HYPC) n=1 Tax=Saccharolobus islandicus (strain HVE10/4) TaxID=930943 RepID=F0NP51_SACI0|nr:HypC/HybG/HupF family hydrogenase formation chaperone [Sulfolobus islandicus]ADX82237.1 hydrogenase expression/formation protein (HUPF/HYPC) [Sulfolobus islandicus HVE10/4]WCM36448.1 HypC/HybG/HupF family hydrogenase formation chaperone [Sulfolobus islandicus]